MHHIDYSRLLVTWRLVLLFGSYLFVLPCLILRSGIRIRVKSGVFLRLSSFSGADACKFEILYSQCKP